MDETPKISIGCDFCLESFYPHQPKTLPPQGWEQVNRVKHLLAICPTCIQCAKEKHGENWKKQVLRFEFASLERQKRLQPLPTDQQSQPYNVLVICSDATMIHTQDHSIYNYLASLPDLDIWFHTEQDLLSWTNLTDFPTIILIGKDGIQLFKKLLSSIPDDSTFLGLWTQIIVNDEHEALCYLAER